MVTCNICGKDYSSKGIGTHIWRSHGEGKSFDPNEGVKNGSKKVWNKGLTKETSILIKTQAEKSLGKISTFKGKTHSIESRKLMSESAKNSLTHNSWTSRKLQSYPERFFENVLKNFNICDYEREFFIKHDNHSNYFLDFYFPNKKIDLEIDGSQHKNTIEKDIERDSFLNSNDIKVFRIEWRNPKTEEGKTYLKAKSLEFLDFYNNAEVV